MGVFEGKSYQDAITALLKSGGDLMAFTPQGAEKMKDVGCRMSSFFKVKHQIKPQSSTFSPLALGLSTSTYTCGILLVVSNKYFQSFKNKSKESSSLPFHHSIQIMKIFVKVGKRSGKSAALAFHHFHQTFINGLVQKIQMK